MKREFKIYFDSRFVEPGVCEVTNEAVALQPEIYKFPVEFHVIEKSEYDKVIKALEWVMAETAVKLGEKQELYMRNKVEQISGYRAQF